MENPTQPNETQQPPPAYPPYYEKPKRPFEKTPFLAGILSIVAGLGNVYNGLYLRGLAFALICFGLFLFAVTNDAPALIPFIIFFWLFNIIDAYRQAMIINFGPPTEELEKARTSEWQASGGLILGAAISVIGVLGFADYLIETFNLRFDIAEMLEDFWWIGFVLFGPWLVFKTIQERRNRNTDLDTEDDVSSALEEAADEAEAA